MVSNRLSVNGIVTIGSYNEADEVEGWGYDAAGNLTSDGITSSTYDALNRLTATSGGTPARSYTYNGDGVLLSQFTGTTTRFTQDLASPLSQVLQTFGGSGAPTDYFYGLDRLASVQSGTRTWYDTDALGSVRQTLSNLGAPLSTFAYDPWGTSEGSTVPPTFGFTGELQDASTGIVNLRARWYQPQHGRFGSRDTFEGFDEQPYSLHPYQYGYSDPILNLDPSGHCVLGLPCPFDKALDEISRSIDALQRGNTRADAEFNRGLTDGDLDPFDGLNGAFDKAGQSLNDVCDILRQGFINDLGLGGGPRAVPMPSQSLRFVADSNIFMDRPEGGEKTRRWINENILASPNVVLFVPASARREVLMVDPAGTQARRLVSQPGGATILPTIDGDLSQSFVPGNLGGDLTRLGSSKFDADDMRIVRRAQELGYPLLSANGTALRRQIDSDNPPGRRAEFGSVNIQVVPGTP